MKGWNTLKAMAMPVLVSQMETWNDVYFSQYYPVRSSRRSYRER